MPLQQAYDDLAYRSLSRIPCELGRLIYLASTREYNTGNYYHQGLADRFGLEAAQKALEIAHRQAFYKVSAFSLEDLVEDPQIAERTVGPRIVPVSVERRLDQITGVGPEVPREAGLTFDPQAAPAGGDRPPVGTGLRRSVQAEGAGQRVDARAVTVPPERPCPGPAREAGQGSSHPVLDRARRNREGGRSRLQPGRE